jgi:hypothetical protein
VEGDFSGSWQHVPKDLVVVVWSGEPREKSVRFFAEQGFRTVLGCFYDARDLNQVKAWLPMARRTPGMCGMMYTTWHQNYSLLPDFGDLLMAAPTAESLLQDRWSIAERQGWLEASTTRKPVSLPR